MKEIFYELIEEASHGNMIIDGEEWPIGFNTIILNNEKEKTYQGNNLSTLRITDEETFFELLNEYISLELDKQRKTIPFLDQTGYSQIKYIMAYLFTNATTEDFLNPEQFIRKYISFLQDETFTYLSSSKSFYIGENFLDSRMEITRKENSIAMETPYKIDFTLVTTQNEKELRCPILSISYGITDDTCYIYSLMKPKESKKELDHEEEKYKKKINRLLYKLNDGVMVSESNEFKEYKNRTSDYYPENITDVTSSFVLGLTSFIALLEKEGIKNIKVVPYLPVRYLSRDIAASNLSNEEKRTTLQERNEMIQYNATNKFIRTFMRVAYHLSDLEIESFPYELDEHLNIKLNEEHTKLNNELLEDVFNIPASFWNNLESEYRECLERRKDYDSLVEDEKYLENIPYNEMAKRNWVEPTRDPIKKVINLRKFFSVASLSFDTELKNRLAFRKSNNDNFSFESLLCWIRYGEIESCKSTYPKYNEEMLNNSVYEIRKLVSKPFLSVLNEVKKILANCGISLIYEPHLPNTYVNGLAYKITSDKAIIMLSDRGKKDDILWFTLFHEIGHLLKHSKKEMFIDQEKDEKNDIELEADEYSRNILINDKIFKDFVNSRSYLTERGIKEFSKENNISTGIVVGRLQKEKYIGWNEYSNLITRIS